MTAVSSDQEDVYTISYVEVAIVVGSAVVVVVAVMMIVVLLVCRWRRSCPCRRGDRLHRARRSRDADVNIDLLPTNNEYGQLSSSAHDSMDLVGPGSALEPFELGDRRNDIVFVADIAMCAFGKVFKATMPHDDDLQDTVIAVKMLSEDADMDAQRQFVGAASTLAALSHSNVVRLIGVCFRRSPFCVLLEYMNAGDLSEYLRRHCLAEGPRCRRLSAAERVGIAVQMASAVAYVSSRGYVHRDVAARNFLVSEAQSSSVSETCVKLSDFVLALRLTSVSYTHLTLPTIYSV